MAQVDTGMYVHKMETVKQSEAWGGTERWNSLIAITYSLWWYFIYPGGQTRQ